MEAKITSTLQELMKTIKKFHEERDWDQFHSPKNLAMNLCVEVAEIAEYFRWLTEDQSKALHTTDLEKIQEEVGDVFINLLNFCDKLNIDPIQASIDKLNKISQKYPSDKVKGKCLKYTAYVE